MTQAAPTPATAISNVSSPSAPKIFLLLAGIFLLGLLIQLPRVADFEKFAFYDEGAWLHLDQLFASGKMPATDIGYSYGMLPIILSRGWFALTGRTPWSFIAFLTLCNLWTTWNFARIIATTSNVERQTSN